MWHIPTRKGKKSIYKRGHIHYTTALSTMHTYDFYCIDLCTYADSICTCSTLAHALAHLYCAVTISYTKSIFHYTQPSTFPQKRHSSNLPQKEAMGNS